MVRVAYDCRRGAYSPQRPQLKIEFWLDGFNTNKGLSPEACVGAYDACRARALTTVLLGYLPAQSTAQAEAAAAAGAEPKDFFSDDNEMKDTGAEKEVVEITDERDTASAAEETQIAAQG
ncbi:hypothetical protein AURDEDRAFT_131564 [Auricularia subglabra TFB-10046 SS5]|uniref:Uncharacterized protein n=1 Tax=Auricularia subglabra (strain TFB-10046 / SS5) TaxID=717982 RepID=J0WMS0_AURST|nr:hypothetical protein AURDEDRAFT_131564 [Auricularia subglabra TFB-10046 SS5]